jgi:hypothetical protein
MGFLFFTFDKKATSRQAARDPNYPAEMVRYRTVQKRIENSLGDTVDGGGRVFS